MNDKPPIQPLALQCEYAVDPLGIDVRRPRFSWRLAADRRGARQTAYQVTVSIDSTTQTDIVWDTGVVESDATNSIEYEGAPLVSRTRYRWAVRVRDENDAWSSFIFATFETAFLDSSEWTATWLASGDSRARTIAPMLRTDFTIDEPIVRARAYVTGLGYYELRLNGEKVGTSVLDPGWTDPTSRVLYATHDITELLQVGVNGVGVQLGIGHWDTGGKTDHETRCQMLLELHVEHPNGKKTVLLSDPRAGWIATTDTPIIENSLFDGEKYDARLELPGWDRAGYVAHPSSSWSRAVIVEPPTGRLVAQALEPIAVVDQLSPVSTTAIGTRARVVDFGQNFAGWARIRLAGAAGTVVTLKYAEILHADGTVNQTNLRSAQATDSYTLRGDGVEEWEPRFTYHGFRYLQIEGLPQSVEVGVEGCVVRSAAPKSGLFSSSSDFLNRLHTAIVWTEASNLHSVPTDCPQRDERLAWLNDVTVRAQQAVYNFNLARLYPKWVSDIRDAQGKSTGAISDTAPWHLYGGRPADPVSASYLLVPWLTYLHYGDAATLRTHYDGFVGWLRYLQGLEVDGLIEFTRYGDWAPPMTQSAGEDTIGAGAIAAHTSGTLISTGYYHYTAALLAKIARVFERDQDAREFDLISARAKTALNERFFDETTGNYDSGNQACNAFALALGLVPEQHVHAVVDNLVEDVIRHDYHVTTGNLTTKYLIDVLTEYGRIDVAYALMTQRTYPSWGFMLDNGATTIWERWEHVEDGPLTGMGSHNHPMYGAVGAWFYRFLAGIDVVEEAPAFGAVRIKPHVLDDLDHVDCALDTVRGSVEVRWAKQDGDLRLSVTLPANTTAEVWIPKSKTNSGSEVLESDAVIWSASPSPVGAEGVTVVGDEEDWLVVAVESGQYEFTSTWRTNDES